MIDIFDALSPHRPFSFASTPTPVGPFVVQASGSYVPGAVASSSFVPGSVASGSYSPGAVVSEVVAP